jgi:molybdopterin converting factor small subunit
VAESGGEVVVQIRYFAALAGLAGRDEESLAVPLAKAAPSSLTVGVVLAAIAQRHPWFVAQRPFVRVARNTDFVRDEDPVEAGDVVALLPPFSGG